MTDAIDRSCGDCGSDRRVMVAMKPGVDRVPWWLCVHCYIESTRKDDPLAAARGRR